MLTERQSAVFRIIRQHVAEYGFAPTLEELCEFTGTKSVGSMSKHVAALASAGLIERRALTAIRAIGTTRLDSRLELELKSIKSAGGTET